MAELWIMKLSNSVRLIAFLLLFGAGCTDRPPQKEGLDGKVRSEDQPQSEDTTYDWERWNWPVAEVDSMTRRAEAGDVEAARRLYQYYVVKGPGEKAAYWLDWLFEQGDPSSMSLRTEKLYESAKKRRHDDPLKLAELQEAEQIYSLLESLDSSYKDSHFIKKLRSEIAELR